MTGKTSSSEFTTYGPGLWGWANNITCTPDNTTYDENGCIQWAMELK